MQEQTARIIINFLEQLGISITAKVEQLVEVSYPIVIRQVYAALIDNIFWVLALWVVSFIFLIVSHKIKNKIDKLNNMDVEQRMRGWETKIDDFKTFRVISFAIGIFVFLFSFPDIVKIIQVLINPQWYAAKLIFNMIQNGGM